MSNVIDSIPAEYRIIFTEIIGAKDPRLLTALHSATEPSRDERVTVMEILSTEFSLHLDPDYEPTEQGHKIDNTLGAFLTRWPIEHD